MPRLENSLPCVLQDLLGSIPGVCLPDVSGTLCCENQNYLSNHYYRSLVGGGGPVLERMPQNTGWTA